MFAKDSTGISLPELHTNNNAKNVDAFFPFFLYMFV